MPKNENQSQQRALGHGGNAISRAVGTAKSALGGMTNMARAQVTKKKKPNALMSNSSAGRIGKY